ncbi:hypothetical protein KC19_1G092500 [Ceratodon purpureus]|uniref:Uncharacterized protein n=1 Tax=Ceratodon purpureus TaxID=3225 RepID=A0A8T0J546_CERPU|nr:hypothetical protein KC19_1G092500 [Ceratodon purpureus]
MIDMPRRRRPPALSISNDAYMRNQWPALSRLSIPELHAHLWLRCERNCGSSWCRSLFLVGCGAMPRSCSCSYSCFLRVSLHHSCLISASCDFCLCYSPFAGGPVLMTVGLSSATVVLSSRPHLLSFCNSLHFTLITSSEEFTVLDRR